MAAAAEQLAAVSRFVTADLRHPDRLDEHDLVIIILRDGPQWPRRWQKPWLSTRLQRAAPSSLSNPERRAYRRPHVGYRHSFGARNSGLLCDLSGSGFGSRGLNSKGAARLHQ
jgi:hypothetical protein